MFSSQDIKEMRVSRGLTQQDFADALGVTRELLSKMEAGKKTISKATQILLTNYVVNEGTKKPDAMAPGDEWRDKYYAVLEENQRTIKSSAVEIGKAAAEQAVKDLTAGLVSSVRTLEHTILEDRVMVLATQEYFLELLAPIVKSTPAQMRKGLGKRILAERKSAGMHAPAGKLGRFGVGT